jgi:hypothetical protein
MAEIFKSQGIARAKSPWTRGHEEAATVELVRGVIN